MSLRGPKARMSRTAEAVAKTIKMVEYRHEGFVGGIVGEWVIKVTDGYRALLVYDEPIEGARTYGLIDGVTDEVEIADPEFYNALKRVKLANHHGRIILKIKPEEKIVELSARGLIDDLFEIEGAESIDIIPGNKTTEGEFMLEAKYVLDALGSWPVTIRYNGRDSHTPILFIFASFAYVVMPIEKTRWGK